MILQHSIMATQDYAAYAATAAQNAGISPEIFVRQIQQESGFNPKALSPAGASGIAQFMPGTARGLGVDPWDPHANLDAAAGLMKSYLDRYGSWELALAAYNAGPGAVEQYGGVPPYPETQTYISKILGGRSPDIIPRGISAAGNNVAVGAILLLGLGIVAWILLD